MPYIGNPIYQSAFVTDQFSGTGSQTAYTMSVAPAGTTNVLVVVSGVVQDPSTYGVIGNTLTFSAAPPSGTGNISCRYLGVPVTGVTTTAYRTVTEFTATSGQTTFTPPSYSVGFINVYLNGVLLGSADYTATNGTTVVLTTGASAGNLLTVESFSISSVANAIANAAGSVSSSNIQTSVTLTTPTIVGQATIPTINLTGGQIAFPATQVASSNANTLDDYEEGTWTPTVTFGGGSTGITYSNQQGRYIKIGTQVTVWIYFILTSKGSSTGGAAISNFPFQNNNQTGASEGNSLCCNYWGNFAGAYIPSGYLNNNGTTLTLVNTAPVATTPGMSDSFFTNTTLLYGVCTYSAAA